MTDQLSLKVANNFGQIRLVRDRVQAFGERSGLPSEVLFVVKLSIEELLINTISYGYTDQETHTIEIQIDLRAGQLNVRMTDDAVAFDPRNAKEPDTKATLKDRQFGGIGIYLVKNLMDHIEYRREGGRNHLTLTKNLEKR